jgi:hypothetical protein
MTRALDRYKRLCFPAAPFRSNVLYRSNIFEAKVNGTNPTATPPYEEFVMLADGEAAKLSSLSIEITSKEKVNLTISTDESYSLVIDPTTLPPSAKLTAPNVYGILHGLESFSQLIIQNEPNVYKIMNTPLHIDDTPRFPWRGLMIDTARHYLPMATIRKALDVMAYNKVRHHLLIIVPRSTYIIYSSSA